MTTTDSPTSVTAPENQGVSAKQVLQAEQDLVELLSRKKHVDRHLAHLETQIYHFETSYLEDTNHVGNVIKGFDGYLNMGAASRTPFARGSVRIRDSDRLFSNSSMTYPKALSLMTGSSVAIERSGGTLRREAARISTIKKKESESEDVMDEDSEVKEESDDELVMEEDDDDDEPRKKKKRNSEIKEDSDEEFVVEKQRPVVLSDEDITIE